MRGLASVVAAAALWGAGAFGGLVEELLEEGDWAGARREGMRWLSEHEGARGAEADGMRCAVAEARLEEGDVAGGLVGLAEVWKDEGATGAARARAGWTAWRAGWDGRRADGELFEALKTAFLLAEEPEWFWRAGCALHFYLKADGGAREGNEGLALAVEAGRGAWPAEVWRDCNPRTNGMREGGGWRPWTWPGRAVVGVYRWGVRPAIGGRCSLKPSCSEYFRQATEKRGLLGIAMGADRLIREPTVNSAAEEVERVKGGGYRVLDPLEAHWLGE